MEFSNKLRERTGMDPETEKICFYTFEEEDYEYQEELEYVELDKSMDQQKNTKQLYMDEDYTEEKELLEAENLAIKKKTLNKRASKRPVERAKETLDVEPISQVDLVRDGEVNESNDIDDPW